MRKRLGAALHALSDGLHARAHRLVSDPEWRVRNGIDAELLREANALAHAAAVVLARGSLNPGEQMELSSHLRGFHGVRKSRCPFDCPLAPSELAH